MSTEGDVEYLTCLGKARVGQHLVSQSVELLLVLVIRPTLARLFLPNSRPRMKSLKRRVEVEERGGDSDDHEERPKLAVPAGVGRGRRRPPPPREEARR